MRKAKRLFYVPGLISLIGLGATLPSFYRENIPVKEYCLQIFVPKDTKDDRFSKYYIQNEIRKKKKIQFLLDDDVETNKKKMDIIRYEALKLKYTEDTTTVILIRLSDSSTYGDYISIVDLCESDGHKRYASWDNKFVIFGEWPKVIPKKEKNIETFVCGTSNLTLTSRASIKEHHLVLSNKLQNKITGLIIGWIFLLLISIFGMRNRAPFKSKIECQPRS